MHGWLLVSWLLGYLFACLHKKTKKNKLWQDVAAGMARSLTKQKKLACLTNKVCFLACLRSLVCFVWFAYLKNKEERDHNAKDKQAAKKTNEQASERTDRQQ